MMHLHSQHVNYIIFSVAAMVMAFFLFRKWEFISQALSEPNKDGTYRGSSRRMVAFIFAFAVCFNETYTTLKTQKFELSHLYALLITLFLCLGLTTFAEVAKVWKGGNNDTKPE